jgi:PAS domain S-box-containing protein
MQHSSRSGHAGWYLVAVTVAAASLLVRWLLDPILGDSMPFSMSIIFGVILSRFSGFLPGVVSVLSGLVASRFLFVEPRGAFVFTEMADLVSLSIPASGGLFIAWMMGQLKISQERAERQSRALLEKQRDYEQELAERRRVESHLIATKADLRLGREEFRTLAEKSPVGIFRTDQTGACTFVNEYWCRLAGITAEETMGTGWARVIHPDDVEVFVLLWQEALHEGRPFVGEYRVCRPDGTIRQAITAAQPVHDEQGKLAHYVGMVIDMTEQKETFESLARKQSLLRSLIEAQEREKSLLCHEFHDGLIQYAVASLMVLESCRHGDREPLSPEAAESIDNVIRFLTVGIEDGRRVIRGIRTAVLDDLGLEAAIDDLADQFETSGIACDTSVDLGEDTLPGSLQTTIYRILQESLSNVRRHSGATKAVVRVMRSGDGMRLSVADDGGGFDRAAGRPRGFGLIGIEERTMLADGECRIDSAPGRGTTVSVRLPIPAEPAPHDVSPAAAVLE